MAVEALTGVVAPPEEPLEAGPESDWEAVQTDLGIRLPNDLLDFCLVYGSGTFVELGMTVFNPFSISYRHRLDATASRVQSLKDAEGDAEVPFDVFPQLPGLFPWGYDDQGAGLFWLAEGDPDDWVILVRGHESTEYHHYEMPLTTFLAEVMQGEIWLTEIWSDELLEDLCDGELHVTFQPFVFVPDTIPRYSIYQLYAQNGNRTGFWAKHAHWEIEGGGIVYVTSIDGKSEGPLIGDNPEGKVLTDFYQKGVLCQEDYELRHEFAVQPCFRLADPPEGWNA